MLSQEQLHKIWDLSDTIIYREAVEFVQRSVKKEGRDPLPSTQMHGLLNLIGSATYAQLEEFITHQGNRDWTSKQKQISDFYKELERYFTTLKVKRLRHEFHLVDEQAPAQEWLPQINTLMIYLAREFIQHMIAENGLLLQAKEEQKKKNKARGSTNSDVRPRTSGR